MRKTPPAFLALHARLAAAAMLSMAAGATHAATLPDGEVIPPGEAAATAEVVAGIRGMVQSGFDATGHAFRDAHRKAHGCVAATFTVPGKLPAQLAQGLFATPRAYNAVIRFSNGSGQSQNDRTGDARGMAIKLMGVGGRKLLQDEASASTQDFLLMNHPVFFVRNAVDYVGFQKSLTAGGLPAASWLLGHAFHETATLLAIASKKVINPLQPQYWSVTPSKLGTQQVKFSARPCAGSTFYTQSDSMDRLRENLEGQLATGGACFDFMAQTRTDPARMPIEDPTIEWSDKRSPFVPVARIQIPAQTPEQGEACEVRSYTPWHSIEAHRPLGGIQRVRKEVYLEISRLRHELNGQPRIEP